MKFVFFIFLVFSGAVVAQIPGLVPEKNWELQGYLKYIGSLNLASGEDKVVDHLIEQRVNYEYRFTPQFNFNGSLRNRLFVGDSAEQSQYGDLLTADFGYFDLSTNSVDEKGLLVNNQLDRLYFSGANRDWQIRAGRFRINWAMTTLWSPNDIFNGYSPYDLNYSERAGRDAFLATRQLGFASSLDVVYNPNQNSNLTSYATRYLFNRQGWDMQLLAGKAQLDYLLGGGVAGDIKGAGVRAEFTWLTPSQEKWHGERVQDSLLASIESDYSFATGANWVGRIAVLYIANPQDAPEARLFLNQPVTVRTLSFAEFTYYADLSFDLSALSRLTLSSSYYSDDSAFIGLSNRYSLADNCQLLAVLEHFTGSATSLFGETPYLLASVQIKWSF